MKLTVGFRNFTKIYKKWKTHYLSRIVKLRTWFFRTAGLWFLLRTIIVVSRRKFQIFVSSITRISSHFPTTNISFYNCSISQISPSEFLKGKLLLFLSKVVIFWHFFILASQETLTLICYNTQAGRPSFSLYNPFFHLCLWHVITRKITFNSIIDKHQHIHFTFNNILV